MKRRTVLRLTASRGTLLKKLIDTEPLSPAKRVVAFGC